MNPWASAAALSTFTPSGTTSLPMPSPGITAMRCVVVIMNTFHSRSTFYFPGMSPAATTMSRSSCSSATEWSMRCLLNSSMGRSLTIW